MCHPDRPDAGSPDVERGEAVIDLADGSSMATFVASPLTGPARASVLVIGDIWGARTPFYEHLAELLADAGFEAIVPEYFHRVGPLEDASYEGALGRKGRLDEIRAIEDLSGAIDWLQARTPGVVGVVGFCLGGTFSLDLAASRTDLATVCFYGFPAGSPGPPSDLVAPAPLDRVDEVTGPIMGFWGARDERVGIANVERLIASLNQRGVDLEASILPDLDHGFLQAAFEPGADGHDLAAESWRRAVDFLSHRLAGL